MQALLNGSFSVPKLLLYWSATSEHKRFKTLKTLISKKLKNLSGQMPVCTKIVVSSRTGSLYFDLI